MENHGLADPALTTALALLVGLVAQVVAHHLRLPRHWPARQARRAEAGTASSGALQDLEGGTLAGLHRALHAHHGGGGVLTGKVNAAMGIGIAHAEARDLSRGAIGVVATRPRPPPPS